MTWQNSNPFISGSTIRADAMNDKLDGIAANLQEIDEERAQRSVRFAAGFSGNNTIPSATPSSLLFLDASGNMGLYPKVTFDSEVQSAISAAAASSASAAAAAGSAAAAYQSEINAAESAELAQQAAVSVAGAAFFAGDWNAATGYPSAPPDGSSIWRATSVGAGSAAGIVVGDYIIWDIIGGAFRRIPGMDRTTDLVTEIARVEAKANAALALAAAGL